MMTQEEMEGRLRVLEAFSAATVQNVDNITSYYATRDYVDNAIDDRQSVCITINDIRSEIEEVFKDFTSNLLSEIAAKFRNYIDTHDLTGMTQEEFDEEFRKLLFE